jgi:hypothetical protein
MSRVQLTLIALGMAFAVPALTGARASNQITTGAIAPSTTFSSPAACMPQPDSDDMDTRWVWRLRAYRHLDCVAAIVERALSSASGDRVELSRDGLERIRAEAWYARDAAARIGI